MDAEGVLVESAPSCLAFSHNGKTLVSGHSDHRIRVWDPRAGGEKATWEGHGAYVKWLAFSADDKTLVSTASSNELLVWDAETGRPRHTLTGQEGWFLSLCLSPDGRTLVTGGARKTDGRLTGEVILWDVREGKLKARLPHAEAVRAVAFSPDGKTLATGTSAGGYEQQSGTLRLWHLK